MLLRLTGFTIVACLATPAMAATGLRVPTQVVKRSECPNQVPMAVDRRCPKQPPMAIAAAWN